MIKRRRWDATERASTIPLGFILLLAIAIVAVNIYQVHYVPQDSIDAEIDSNREMLSDVQGFNFAVQGTIGTQQGQPVAIGKSVEYPISFPSPEDPSYIIATTETETIRFENFRCEIGDCQSNMNTTTVIFLGDYNYLENDRVYGYEYGVVYSAPNSTPEGNNGVITYNDQFMIQGNKMTLLTFQGDFTHERQGTVHTTISPQDPSQHENVITDDGTPLAITLPTEISESQWNDMLSEELVENGGHITDITYQNYTVEREDSGPSGNEYGEPKHWEDCDHPGKGRPFVTCTIDNSTSYVTVTLEQDEEYTIETEVLELSE